MMLKDSKMFTNYQLAISFQWPQI